MTTDTTNRTLPPAALLGMVVGVLLAIVIVVGVFWLAWSGLDAFTRLNPTVASGVVTASVTIIVSVLSVLISKNLEQRRAIDQQVREKKLPGYEALIKLILDVIYAEKLGKKMKDEELIRRFVDVSQQLLVWGSDDVVKAWSAYRLKLVNGVPTENSLPDFERLLVAIRKDTGHTSSTIVKGDLLSLFLNDAHKYL